MAGETVTIACKLPHGLKLRVFDMVERTEHVMGGGSRAFKLAQPKEKTFNIAGFAHPQNAAPKAQLIEGYALTHGVDKDFWDLWIAQNADADMVKNGLIFAHVKQQDTNAEAREKKTTRSGLERLEVGKLPARIENSIAMSQRGP